MRTVHKEKFIETMLTIYGMQKTEKQRRELLFRIFDVKSIGRIMRTDMKIVLYHMIMLTDYSHSSESNLESALRTKSIMSSYFDYV